MIYRLMLSSFLLLAHIGFSQAIDLPSVAEDSGEVVVVGIPTPYYLNPTSRQAKALDQDSSDRLRQANNLQSYLAQYWTRWAKANGFQIEFEVAATNILHKKLVRGEINMIALTSKELSGNEGAIYSVPYIGIKTALYRRSGELSSSQTIGLHLPKQVLVPLLNPKNAVVTHSISLDAVFAKATEQDHIVTWDVQSFEAKLQSSALNNTFIRVDQPTPSISLQAMTLKSEQDLLLNMNTWIRTTDNESTQQLWDELFVKDNPVYERYTGFLTNLTEKQERLISAQASLSFVNIVQGEEPYFINDEVFLDGYIVDVLFRVSRGLGVDITATDYLSFQAALDAVKQNEVDIFAGIYKTKGRSQSLDFSVDIDHTLLAIISERDYYKTSELVDQRLAMVRGFYENELVAEKLPENPIIFVDTAEEAIRAVADGKADAFVGKMLSSAYLINKLNLHNLAIHRAQDLNADLKPRIALAKDQPEWVQLLNQSLNSLGGDYQQQLQQKWRKYLVFSREAERVSEVYQRSMWFLLLASLVFTLWFIISRQQNAKQKRIQATLKNALEEAEKAKQKAEAMTQAKSDFLARMSHEIRTPMNGVLGMAEALSFTQLDTEQEDLLNTLNGSACNLMALLNDVLDFSKMDAGKLTLESTSCNLSSVATNVINNFRHKAASRNLQLSSYVDPKLAHSYLCDGTRLMQVINNLISNSIKFSETGFIELNIHYIENHSPDEVGNKTDLVRVHIRDSGIGIHPDKLNTLFDPFVQADGDITRRFGGTGLGLSICHEIVTEMNGEIHVSSVQGHGSLFSITLPLEQDSERTFSDTHLLIAEQGQVSNFSGLTVLLAEDNEVNQKVIGGQLSRLNVDFVTANNGQEAFDLMSAHHVDVVLSDCHMPIMDGFTLAKNIAETYGDDKPYLIAITADALSGAAEKCLNAGFDDYLSKPCPIELLNSKLTYAYTLKGLSNATKPANHTFDLDSVLFGANNSWEFASEQEVQRDEEALSASLLALMEEFCSLDDSDVKVGEDFNHVSDFDVARHVDDADSDLNEDSKALLAAHHMRSSGHDLLDEMDASDFENQISTAGKKNATNDESEVLILIDEDIEFHPEHILLMCGDDMYIALDILTSFVDNYPQDIEELAEVVAQGDMDRLKSTAHRVKGSLLYLGAQNAADQAKFIEVHAMELGFDEVEQRVQSLSNGIKQLGEQVREYCTEALVAS
ncbi:ATP-binding protein [Vibrio tapetis subsp. quintayensis]|uniref:ATP-binding protein n=1 Tax=Vibrio tapetis TaxID=52443 RepID=UPI0025B47167|nr:transporter substrate-binding domain-containing protein [Vibrio tapetis]MDN3681040.1 ATP-binding protein [Vibrio tapetis subsp. quintayensis]